MQHAGPIADILRAQRSIEPIRVAHSDDVGRRRAFPEHLRDGIAGDKMDEQKNDAYDQPDDREGEEDALEDELQLSVPKCWSPGLHAVGVHSYNNRI